VPLLLSKPLCIGFVVTDQHEGNPALRAPLAYHTSELTAQWSVES
jgi:hypothetical protein